MLADLPRLIPLMDALEVLEGDTFQQSCIAQSSPPPLLTWLKDGQIITDPSVSVSSPTPSMAILVVPQVAHSHSGTYTCSASNQAGQTEESIVLVVNGTTFLMWNIAQLCSLIDLVVCTAQIVNS